MRHPVIAEDLRRITEAPLPWERLAGKSVLVAGAAGFLPAYVVETLEFLNETRPGFGCRVTALVRGEEKARRRFAHLLGRPGFTIVPHDLSRAWEAPAGEKFDFIVHAASQASPRFYGSDPVGTLLPNVIGTHSLLETARKQGTEGFLYFSSGEVYGQVSPDRIPIRETSYGHLDPANVRSCYAEGKRAAETLCVSYAHQYGVPAKIVRPFHTYGPGMALNDGRVFADFVANVVRGEDIVLKSDGGAVRPFCYLADAVAGYFTVLLCGETGLPYNVGNDRTEISVKDLALLLAGLFPEKKLRVRQEAAAPAPGYLASPVARVVPDLSRIAGLGWRPSTSLREGFSRTILSYSPPTP